jgi:hypothetical protein
MPVRSAIVTVICYYCYCRFLPAVLNAPCYRAECVNTLPTEVTLCVVSLLSVHRHSLKIKLYTHIFS